MTAQTTTQVRYPWRAAARTALAYIVSAAVVLPVAWQIVEDGLREYIPPELMTSIAWAVGGMVAVATTVTRIMALPQVAEWMTKIGLGPSPRIIPGAVTVPPTMIPTLDPDAQVVAGVQDDLGTYTPERAAP